jgi:glutamate-1-semialdehyde 2,1-aminomutase
LIHPRTYNNNVFSMSAGIVGLDIFNGEKLEELNARGDRMRAEITQVFFEMGIYAQEHANQLKDAIEVDSFEGNT